MLVSGVQQSDSVMLMVSFDEREILILMKTNLFFLLFLLLLMLSILYLRNHCLTQDHKDILLFSSDSFIVLALTFKSVIHFVLIFIFNVK